MLYIEDTFLWGIVMTTYWWLYGSKGETIIYIHVLFTFLFNTDVFGLSFFIRHAFYMWNVTHTSH